MSYDKCSIAFYACAENITPAKDLPDNEEEVEFNDQFLLNGSANIDINRFSHGNPVLPGTYRTKINLNGKLKSTVEVTFKDNGTPRATPCITKLLLSQSGVDTSTLPDGPEDDETCVDIKNLSLALRLAMTVASRLWILIFPRFMC